MTGVAAEDVQPARGLTSEAMMSEEQPLKEANVESLFPLSNSVIDLEKMDILRRSNHHSEKDDGVNENDWNKYLSETLKIRQEELMGSFSSALKEFSKREKELLMVAACLGSFDSTLLQASTSLPEESLSEYLNVAVKKGVIIQNENDGYKFVSDEAEREVYGLIPPKERLRFHLKIGRNLVRNLSHDQIENSFYAILLQFHCAVEAITGQTERNAVAVLCLRSTHCAVAASNFHAACNYSEFGTLLLGPDCWKYEYDLSLALYNASAEVSHCVADFERVDKMVTAVLDNARCFRDTLRARAARVHSLSSAYRMREALQQGLDILRHLGEKFPTKPRAYHALFAFVRTKRLLRGKTNEMILRMPLMKDLDKIAAIQMLNLIFPNAFHVDPILFVLLSLRMVRLSALHGLTAASAVGFASYSSMLATYQKDKTEGFRYCELSLELIRKFEAKEYIPRAYFFLYTETMAHKYDIRALCTYLYRAYQVGLETGDVEFALVNSNMCFGYMLLSGQSLEAIEEKTNEFYKAAVAYKQEFTLGTMRPALKCLGILTDKVERPIGFAFQDDLKLSEEAGDEAAAWIIHFMQLMLSYMFGDYETAAQEADAMEPMMKLHLHPGFSSILAAYCLALLAIVNNRRGRHRREILSKVRWNVKRLEDFSSYIPENSLHKLSLVQAELAVIDGDYGVARGKFMIAISLSIELADLALCAVANERFAIFIKSRQGNGADATKRFRDAHVAYKKWGVIAKAKQMEEDMPQLLSKESSIIC